MRRYRVDRKVLARVVFIALVFALLGPGYRITSAHLADSSFTIQLNNSPVAPFGIAATPARLLVVVCATGPAIKVLSVSVDSLGVATATVFASISGNCSVPFYEPDIAIAPATPDFTSDPPSFPSQNAAGFHSNYAYVAQPTNDGLKIWQVTHEGFVGGDPFVTLADCAAPTDRGNIAFSRVIPEPTKPSFGPHGTMIVSCTNGKIWRVLPNFPGASAGTATQKGNLNTFIEGPDVAPLTFSAGPGNAFFGSESDGWVYSLSPRGQVKRVVRWPAANEVDFVPAPKCDFLTSGGTYFTIVGGDVWKFPQSSLTGRGGKAALVTRGLGTLNDPNGIGLLTADKGGSITAFHRFEDSHHGSAFAYCDPTIVAIEVEPQTEPNVINFGSNGLVTVLIFGSATFDVGKIIQASLTFGWTGNEQSWNHCTEGKKDLNDDTFLDLECKFRIAQLGVPLQNQQPGVGLILKGQYLAPSGDPPLEGFD